MDSKVLFRSKLTLLLVPSFLFLFTVAITLYVSALATQKNSDQFKARFDALANQTTLLIQEKLNTYPLLLQSTRGLVANNLEGLDQAWPRFFQAAQIDYAKNGIIGITFTRYIDQQNKQRFISQQQKAYGPGFKIFPETNHGDFFVLMHAAPAHITDKVRGYDIGSEPNRRFAAERAKTSSTLALSAPISLIPTNPNSLDYLLLLPVETPDKSERYKNNFHGWITIGFSLSMLIEDTLKTLPIQPILSVIDARAGLSAKYDSTPLATPSNLQERFKSHQTLSLSQQKIDLYFSPKAQHLPASLNYRYDPDTLAAGIMISILATLASFLLLSGRERALHLADNMLRRFRDTHIRYQALFDSSPEAILLCVNNKIVLANTVALNLLGAKQIEQLVGTDVLDRAIPENRKAAGEMVEQVLRDESCTLPPFEETLTRLDGQSIEVELMLSRTTYDDAAAVQIMFRDITATKQRRDEAKIAQKVLEHTTEAIMVTDKNARIVMTNPAFTSLTGYNDKQAQGQKTSILRSGHHDTLFYKQLWGSLLRTGQWIGELANRKRSGEVYIQKTNISAVYDKRGDISHFVCVMSDITEQKRDFDNIRFQALHDTLTKLPNRVHFEARAEKALSKARNADSKFAILFIDLDKFKPINDTYGHLLGDKLLISLADRMAHALRPSDIVARIGGDEFLILADDLNNTEEAQRLAERLMNIIVTPITLDGVTLHLSASIGIAAYPDDEVQINLLIHAADQAMYDAKRRSSGLIARAGAQDALPTDDEAAPF